MTAYQLAIQTPSKTGYVFISFKSFRDLEYYYTRMPTLIPRDENSTIEIVRRGAGLGPGVHNYDDFRAVEEPEEIADNNRYCYEIISGKRCPYWDFDGYIDDSDITELTASIKHVLREYPICVNLYNSNGKKPDGTYKHSYHVIVKGVVMPDHRSCETVCHEIVKRCSSERLHAVFDSSVYSSKRNFRLIGSRKLGDSRIKVHDRLLYSSPGFRSSYSGNALYMSMSSACADSIPFAVNVETETRSKPSNDTIDTEEVRRLVDEHFRGIFEIGRMTNGILTLTRKKPSYCPICSRNHDKSDAFVTRSYKHYQFRCYRNPKATPVVLDEDDDEDVEIEIVDDTEEGELPNTTAVRSETVEKRMIKRRRGEMTLEDYAERLRQLHAWQ